MRDVPLRDIMISNVICAHENDLLSSVEVKMRENGIRHLPVVDRDHRIMGIMTYRDLLSCAPPHRTEDGLAFDAEQMDHFILKHVMTKNPQTLAPEDTVAHAVAIMARDKYGCIPIASADKKLLGIVTQIDILKWLGKKLEQGKFLTSEL